MSKNFDLRPYSINDFREWSEKGDLILSPKFQRRRVWSTKAKSYLIDTILRGLPIPPVFIRQKIDTTTKKTVREVIDGQQRLGAILDFLRNGFKVSKIHNEEYGNIYFNELSHQVQREFLEYVIAANLVLSTRDEDVLEIFSRLNTYTITLNKQELWNAEYFGLFKQTVHSLAYEFHTFWVDSKILSEQKIARMGDVELTSELVIASIDGIQDKKVIKNYYKKNEETFPEKDKTKRNFKKCIDTIGEIYGELLPNSYFNGAPLFYTLYCVIYDLLFSLKNSSNNVRIKSTPSDCAKIRDSLENLEATLGEPKNRTSEKPEIAKFMEDYTVHTTNLPVRKRRHDFLLNFILQHLNLKK